MSLLRLCPVSFDRGLDSPPVTDSVFERLWHWATVSFWMWGGWVVGGTPPFGVGVHSLCWPLRCLAPPPEGRIGQGGGLWDHQLSLTAHVVIVYRLGRVVALLSL